MGQTMAVEIRCNSLAGLVFSGTRVVKGSVNEPLLEG